MKYEMDWNDQIGVELDLLDEYTWLSVHVPSSQVLGLLSPELPCWEGPGTDGLGICSGTRHGRTQMPWHWSRLQNRKNRKVGRWCWWAPGNISRTHFLSLGFNQPTYIWRYMQYIIYCTILWFYPTLHLLPTEIIYVRHNSFIMFFFANKLKKWSEWSLWWNSEKHKKTHTLLHYE